MNQVAMVINLDRCIGCHTCTVACQMEKGLPPDLALIPVGTLGGVQDVPQGTFPSLYMDYLPKPCAHCQTPSCAAACPTGALYQRGDGLVVMDATLCSGCEDCVPACPYKAVVMDGDLIARKCDLCASRLDQGLEPFCVICCPTRAICIGGAQETDRSWAPAPHRGTGPTLRYLSRDPGRVQRIHSFFSS